MPDTPPKGGQDDLASYLMSLARKKPMPKAPRPPHDPTENEMPERDPTPDEILKVPGALDPPAPLTPPDPTRDLPDDDDTRPVARPLSEVEQMQHRFDTLLAQLTEQQQKAAAPNDMLASAIALLAQGLQGMQHASLQGANTIAEMQRRTTMPENRAFPAISWFNLRGDKDFPRPVLKCEMFLPWPVDDGSSLTREEIELLNLLEQGEYTIFRTDRSRVKVTVRIETKLDSDEPVRLLVNHETAFSNDYHNLMPFNWIRQMVESKPSLRDKARAILTMEDEEALIVARKFNDGTSAREDQSVVSVGA
jgi:hypothetical protein